MSNIVKVSEIGNLLREAKEYGVEEVTIRVPYAEYQKVLSLELFGFHIGSVTENCFEYKEIRFNFSRS